MFSHCFWHSADYMRHHSSGSKQSENYIEIMSCISRYEKLLSAADLDMWAIDETVQYWEKNDLENTHSLNHIKMDYRNSILRRLHRLRAKAELLAAESHEAGDRWSGCRPLGCRPWTLRSWQRSCCRFTSTLTAAQLQQLPFSKGIHVFWYWMSKWF